MESWLSSSARTSCRPASRSSTPVFFPEGVETQDLDGSTSIDGYCGYHSSFGSGAAIVLLERAVRAGRLGPGRAPNGEVVTDSAIGRLTITSR
jgi:hypothetical protein